MNRIVLFFLMLFASTLNAQVIEYAKIISNNLQDVVYDQCIDLSGNHYIVGTIANGSTAQNIDMDPGAGVSNIFFEANVTNAFVIKFSQAGSFKWAKVLAGYDGANSFSQVNAVAIDTEGNVLLVGDYKGKVDFDPGIAEDTIRAHSFNSDVFTVKLDSLGNYVWSTHLSSIGINNGFGVVSDLDNNIYVGGAFNGLIDFDPGVNLNDAQALARDLFLQKLDANGNLVDFFTLGNGGPDILVGLDIIPEKNLLFFDGYFTGGVDFNPDPNVVNQLLSQGSVDGYVACFDLDLGFKWVKQFGGTSPVGAYELCHDDNNNIYVGGIFKGVLDVNTDTSIVQNLTNASLSEDDIFIAKLDTLGNFYWGSSYGGIGPDIIKDLSFSNGQIYTSGYFTNDLDLDPGTGSYLLNSNASSSDVFVSSLNAMTGAFDSTVNLAIQIGGSDTDEAYSIIAQGNIYITGKFNGLVNFAVNGATENFTSNSTDGFFVKYRNCVSSLGADVLSNFTVCYSSESEIYVNPSSNLEDNMKWVWYDNNCGSQKLGEGDTLHAIFYLDQSIYVRAEGGCDYSPCSSLSISINPLPDNQVDVDGLVLTALAEDLSYQWLSCETNQIITGATEASFVVTENGSYAVALIDSNSCANTSDCIDVSSVGLRNSSNVEQLGSIYPNPFINEVNIQSLSLPISEVLIFNVFGQEVYKSEVINNFYGIDLSALSPGAYLAVLYYSNNYKEAIMLVKSPSN